MPATTAKHGPFPGLDSGRLIISIENYWGSAENGRKTENSFSLLRNFYL
jgi:hypothetical protein